MFLEKLIRQMKGYVEIEARGGFPERFINLCSKNSVNIQNVKMFKETITASCDIKSYLKIRPVAKKSGMKVRLIKKHGLPFWLHKERKRVGVIFGVIFLIVITSFLSGRIWTIDVSGNENIPSEDITEYFYDLGVKTGIKTDSLDAKETARQALKKIDGIMWTAVNVDGCKITIEVKERVEKITEADEDGTPSNIIASNSGQIILIENFIGTPVVEVGSAVQQGDVIVSGAVINKDESVSFYKAQANVIAKTKNTVAFTESPIQDMRVYDKVKNKYFLTFFNLKFPVNYLRKPQGDFDFSSGEDFLASSGVKMPLGITTERYARYKTQKVKLNSSALKLICAEKYFKEIDERFDNIEIEKITSEIKSDKFSVTVSSTFECIEDISESKIMDLQIDKAE